MADAEIRIDGRIASRPPLQPGQRQGRRKSPRLGGPIEKERDTAPRKHFKPDRLRRWRSGMSTAPRRGHRADKGDSVIMYRHPVTGVESYAGQNGESLSIKVSGDGVRVFPKQQQSGGGSFGDSSRAEASADRLRPSRAAAIWGNQQQAQQSSGWGQNPGGNDVEPLLIHGSVTTGRALCALRWGRWKRNACSSPLAPTRGTAVSPCASPAHCANPVSTWR